MNIWYFSDGKPGHVHQTLGLIDALERRSAVTVEPIRCEQLSHSASAWLRGGLPRGFSNRLAAAAQTADRKPAVLLGAGHATHAALLATARVTGATSVVIMKPTLPQCLFDVVIAPEHDGIKPGRHVFLTKGAINRMRPEAKEAGSGLMLLGGPSRHARWDEAALLDQIQQLLDFNPDQHWILANSRRTPVSLWQATQELAQVESVHWQDCARGWLGERLAVTEQVVVTPDSVSMIYEALTAGAQVALFDLQQTNTRVARGVSGLLAEQQVQPLATLLAGGAGRTVPAHSLHEADRTAVWLLAYLSGVATH